MKRIEINGKFYRMRRGKLVQIPDEWVGKTVYSQTIRNRDSKQTRKARRRDRWKWPRTKQSGSMGPDFSLPEDEEIKEQQS